MAKQSSGQRRTVGRVMHEFKKGELESSRGGKVKRRRQAVAIALSEAGSSRNQSRSQNRRQRTRTKTKESRGQTAQQRKEGRSSMGSTRAELYREAMRREIPGRSSMNKSELERALRRRRA